MECDYCGNVFEPRGPGRKQRFCPRSRCKTTYYEEAGRDYAKVLKRRRALEIRPRGRTVDEKLSLLMRSIWIAQQLETAGHEVYVYTRYLQEVHIEHWPVPKRKPTDMATHLFGGMINLVVDRDKEDFEYYSVPSRGSFNEFRFFVDGKSLSMDEAAALLTVTAQPVAFGAQN